MTRGSKMLGDVWQRWSSAWHKLFFTLCGLSLILALTESPANQIVPFITLTILLMSWYLPSIRGLSLSNWGYAVYFAVGWLIWYTLTGYHPVFFMILGGLYPQVFTLIRLPLSVGFAFILNVLVLILLQRLNSELTFTWMLITMITWVGGALLAYYITDIIQQSDERRDLINQLKTAQARIADMERQAGIAQERERLAGELHDTITQGLVGIITQLEAAEVTLDDRQRYLDGAKTLARENLSEARRFIWELRPPALEGRLFEEGLRGMTLDWSTMHRLPVEVVTTGITQVLNEAQQVALLRVTQEALTNISKHAQAKRVTVTLSYMPNAVILDVNDDGVGFAPGENGHGFGLVNMRGRLAALNGILTIESTPSEGTTIVAEMPLQPGEGCNGAAPADR